METPPGDPETPATWQALPSWLLTQTAGHAHRLVTDAFAAAGARGYHYRLLATLEQFGPSSQAGLSRRTGIHVSDTVGALNELADRDLVHRAPDPTDRRRNIISLTTAGKRQLRRLEKPLADSQDELLAPLSQEERQRFTTYLSRLLTHHNHGTDRPPSGAGAGA